jgi:hypothetical protein
LLLLVAGAQLVAACGRDIDAAFKPEPGPYRHVVASPVVLEFPALEKDLLLRLTYPEAPGQYPVILFSHGGRCSRDRYTGFAEHWASHGYVVIQPAHLDSVSIKAKKSAGGSSLMQEAADTRPLDMSYIVDSFERLEELEPGLAGKIDAERIVAAGHSLGGGTAMTLTGLVLVNPRDGTEMGGRDERFDALLLITNPSNNPLMPEDPWRAVAVPTFVSTGSKDFSSLAGRVRKGFGFQFRDDVSFADTPNHYLYIDGMDHYLGGLICRDKPAENPDDEALQIINGVSTAFLDAYIKDDARALAFIRANQMPATVPRATLETR